MRDGACRQDLHQRFANAPVPGRKGGNAAGSSDGLFLAIPATLGASGPLGWPAQPFAVKLESPDRRVARGGDLILFGDLFVRLADHYGQAPSPNFGFSNAMLLSRGSDGSLSDIACPAYSTITSDRLYTYTPGPGRSRRRPEPGTAS